MPSLFIAQVEAKSAPIPATSKDANGFVTLETYRDGELTSITNAAIPPFRQWFRRRVLVSARGAQGGVHAPVRSQPTYESAIG